MDDLDGLMALYAYARQQMRQRGNVSQWVDGYPEREVIAEDIRQGYCYVFEDSLGICGVFAFIIGADPTYALIEDGKWLNDEPYGTIHRIAGYGRAKGLLGRAVAFALGRIANVRCDTHADNAVMRHLLEKLGFVRCGRIYTRGGAPRIAYHLIGKEQW
ncbi:N-acetyltransferase [bacterium]|nr:N-acetyltransferase [bacterium]